MSLMAMQNIPPKDRRCLESPCRLCADLCNRDIDQIFSNDNKYLVDLIEKYLSIKIAMEDTLPIQVCEPCRVKVISFDEYALKCSTTQIILTSQENTEIVNALLDKVKIECIPDIKDEITNESSFESDNGPIENYRKKYTLRVKMKHSKSTSPKKKLKTDENINAPTKQKRCSVINKSFVNFDCHLCSEEFLQWNTLEKHTKQKHKVKPKVLCLCGKYLSCNKTLYNHIKVHNSSSFHKCTQCKNSFLTEENLEKHILSTHSNTAEHKCNQCQKTFTKAFILRKHAKTHVPKEMRYKLMCDICGAKFGSKYAVRIHISTIHNKERPFVCDICGHTSATKGNMKTHRFLHGSERPHHCPHCPKTFKQNKQLKLHVDVHNGVTYQCSKCPSSFSSAKTLREHMNVHTDVCRFTCGFCNKGFKWRRSIESHLNLHTGKTPFSCPWCPKTFADRSNCRIHKRRMHPAEVAESEATTGKRTRKNIKIIVPAEDSSIPNTNYNDVVKPS